MSTTYTIDRQFILTAHAVNAIVGEILAQPQYKYVDARIISDVVEHALSSVALKITNRRDGDDVQ